MSDPNSVADEISFGASAAGTLAGMRSREDDSPRPGIVRDLALNLERRLRTLASCAEVSAAPDLLADAAQACGDLATLAACNADVLGPRKEIRQIIETARETTRNLQARLEAVLEGDDTARADLLSRDVGNAAWKASLASRQLDDAKPR